MSDHEEYVQWTERNDHEGETWSVFLPNTDTNVEALQILGKAIDKFDLFELYDYDPRPVPASEVEILVRRGDVGYFPRWQVWDDELLLVACEELASTETEMVEGLYKLSLPRRSVSA